MHKLLQNVFLTLLILWFPGFLMAQGLINNGAYIKVSGGAYLKVDGHLTNQANATIANDGTLCIHGNFSQTGTSTAYTGNGSFCFSGSSNQTFYSATAFSLHTLQVDNGQQLILGSNLGITNTLNLANNGYVALSNFDLTIASGGAVTNYGTGGYVRTTGSGSLIQEVGSSAVVFPVGNTAYNPATITNAGTTDNFGVRLEDELLNSYPSGTALTDQVVTRAWHLTEATTGGSDVTLTLQWNESQEAVAFDRAQSGIAHWNGTNWDRPAYTIATSLGGSNWSQTLTGITSFSPFGVESNATGLPIELLSFEASRLNTQQVVLQWSTITETNNRGFDIEMSADGQGYKKVGFVAGAGDHKGILNYKHLVMNSQSAYYRLKQIDYDGQFAYSPVQYVEGVEVNLSLQVYPNPTQGKVTLDLGNYAEEVTLWVHDMQGKTLLKTVGSLSQLNERLNAQLPQWANGAYYIKLITPQQTFTKQFVLNRR
ncbi:MAG TPA: hypothetical protein DCS93_19570 [Microscillaceae bacterium]|nr:hypothetical protein [Microscillaceae bacterium]